LKTVLITGGTSGLGLELVKYFLRKGFAVYATGREGKQISGLGESVRFVKVDFSEPADVIKNILSLLAQGIRFDIVINNAGVLSPPEFAICSNGIEFTYQVNFISHLLINDLIIKESDNSKPQIFVSVTSPVYKLVKPEFRLPEPEKYRSFKTYAESKYYMLLTGDYLMNKYHGKNLKFIGFNPGTFSSQIYRMQKRWFRNLYLVAGPFMKGPARVAAALGDVLTGTVILNGMIYKSRNSFTEIESYDKDDARNFIDECSAII